MCIRGFGVVGQWGLLLGGGGGAGGGGCGGVVFLLAADDFGFGGAFGGCCGCGFDDGADGGDDLFAVLDGRGALGEGEVLDVEDGVEGHVGDGVLDDVGDVGDDALDFEVGDDLLEDAALGGAAEFDGDGDGDAFVEVDACEVDVEDFDAEVVVLDVLDEDGFGLAVE